MPILYSKGAVISFHNKYADARMRMYVVLPAFLDICALSIYLARAATTQDGISIRSIRKLAENIRR